MKFIGGICALVVFPGLLAAAEKPDWAFPVTDKVQPAPRFSAKQVRKVGKVSNTRAKAEDQYSVPDWRPESHPRMPKIVQYGNKRKQVRACGSCHLPTGTGLDDSAYLAGLPAAYLTRQMADWKRGDRKFSSAMVTIAKGITDAEIKDAANYFAALKTNPWIKVVETDTVPRAFVGPGDMRLTHPGGGTEPLGNRVVEFPEDEEAAVYRDPVSGFVAYVPKGSIARGEALVKTGGGGRTVACGACHGPLLQGLAGVPGIAGRHPNYIVRQMWNMQNGDRTGFSAEVMKPVVEKLTNDEMLQIAAYIASLKP